MWRHERSRQGDIPPHAPGIRKRQRAQRPRNNAGHRAAAGRGAGLSMQRGEVWKDIPGYEDLYQVSNMGRIRAFPKMTRIGNKKRFCEMRFLSPIVQHSGYAHIGLWRNGDCKQARLHRLVAEAFCVNDNPQCKTQVNHLNEDKLDNRAENLEWVTAKENTNYGTCIEKAHLWSRTRCRMC